MRTLNQLIEIKKVPMNRAFHGNHKSEMQSNILCFDVEYDQTINPATERKIDMNKKPNEQNTNWNNGKQNVKLLHWMAKKKGILSRHCHAYNVTVVLAGKW